MIDLEIDEAAAEPGGVVLRGTRERDAFLLSLYGELDIAGARVLERRIQIALSSRSGRVVVDLSGLQFMDSAGLHALVRVQAGLRQAGQTLALLRGPRAVQQVFDLTETTALFDFEG